jgi:hypothetical protein
MFRRRMTILFTVCSFVALVGAVFAQTPQLLDFGPDGTVGLTEDELNKLSEGGIVFVNRLSAAGERGAILVESAVLFSNTPDRTWALISATEKQPVYLANLKSVKVLSKSSEKAIEIFTAKLLFFKFIFGVVQNYNEENKWLHWSLYADYPENDVDSLSGFWQLYPYEDGKTLARYGTYVALKNVPDFIENMFRKSSAKQAMISVKKYVDSDGQYRK